MSILRFILKCFGFYPRYRVEELHTPRFGVLYYAQVKEWFGGSWKNIYANNNDWAREHLHEQWRIIKAKKESRIPQPPLKTVYHYSKP